MVRSHIFLPLVPGSLAPVQQAIVQRHIQPHSLPILAFSTHPGAVATGQQAQFKTAYGDTAGGVMASVVRPFMSRPDQGAISALWAGVSGQLRTESDKFENGSYFTEADEEGGETKEASDQEVSLSVRSSA